MAYDEPGYPYPPAPTYGKKKPKLRIPLPGGGSLPVPDVGDFTPPPAFTQPPQPDWRGLIESDPGYQQGIADLLADALGDKTRTTGWMRDALVRFGGPGLQGIIGKLGPGWEDLLDPTTLQAASSGDTAGTSLHTQLEKAHAGRNLALQDVLAAKGILSSGQTGYELGEERQRHTNASNDAINGLLDFLRGQVGGFAGRESDRGKAKSGLGESAFERLFNLGIEPPVPPPLPDFSKILKPKKKKKAGGLVE
jgi:hypothetical protein